MIVPVNVVSDNAINVAHKVSTGLKIISTFPECRYADFFSNDFHAREQFFA